MEIKNNGHWTYIINEDVKLTSPIIGKYLFFSSNKEELIELAKTILNDFELSRAKVPTKSRQNTDYVLCVYSIDDNLKYKLKQYETNSIRYRYFKTDADTKAGKYSNQYLNQISKDLYCDATEIDIY